MRVLDTDTLTLLLHGHERVGRRRAATDEEVAITLITRLEMLRGRIAALTTAEDGPRLLRAQERLVETERDLGQFLVLPFAEAAAGHFDRLRREKKLRKAGRCDLLIACIVLAHGATLVTRNTKDCRDIPGLAIENWAD